GRGIGLISGRGVRFAGGGRWPLRSVLVERARSPNSSTAHPAKDLIQWPCETAGCRLRDRPPEPAIDRGYCALRRSWDRDEWFFRNEAGPNRVDRSPRRGSPD